MRTNPLIEPAVGEVPAHREEAFFRGLGFGRTTAARGAFVGARPLGLQPALRFGAPQAEHDPACPGHRR